jgi:hypothetical protein
VTQTLYAHMNIIKKEEKEHGLNLSVYGTDIRKGIN